VKVSALHGVWDETEETASQHQRLSKRIEAMVIAAVWVLENYSSVSASQMFLYSVIVDCNW
jgi:hypothetical protein